MTEIVRASLGLPTLRAGPQFQNPKPSHHLKKENFKYVLVIEYWNLRFICNLVLGIWDLGMRYYRFQCSTFSFLLPDTRHLTPESLIPASDLKPDTLSALSIFI